MKVYSYILNVATICPGKSGLQTNFEPLLFLLISQVFKAYWAQVTLKQINRWIFYLQQTNIFLLNISNEIWYYTISLVHSMSVFVNESKPWMSYISRVCLWVKKKVDVKISYFWGEILMYHNSVLLPKLHLCCHL